MKSQQIVLWLVLVAAVVGWPGSAAGQDEADHAPAAAPAAAAEREHHADDTGHGEGEVNIFAGNMLTALLTVGVFLVLLVILGRFAWGPLLQGLQQREDGIRRTIENAEARQQEAQGKLAEYEAKLALAHAEAEKLIAKGRAEAVELGERLRTESQAEAQKLRDQARHDIELARDRAVRGLYRESYQMALDLAGRIVAREVSPADHEKLLEESLAQLGREES